MLNYEPWILEALRAHIEQGWSFTSFAGKHKIPAEKLLKWAREIPELDAIRNEYNLNARKPRRFL